jgi:hypothetical protein
MVQAVVVCYALFDPLFVAIMLVGSGEVDAKVYHDQLSHECQHFLLDHFLDPNCVYYTSSYERQHFLLDHFLDPNCVCLHIKLVATPAFPCSLFFHTTNRLQDF